MFTGIIEEIGIVRNVHSNGGGRRIAVEADKIFEDLRIDDSVSLDGVCQTVVAIKGKIFEFDTVEETLKKTTLGKFSANQKINLERAVTPNTRLGGHIVQGHTDCVGRVVSIENLNSSRLIKISFPTEFEKYIVTIGSICVNGVSLTAARVEGSCFTVSIIPHTLKSTTLSELVAGSEVNLEFDILGKYIEKMMGNQKGESLLDKYVDQPMI